MITKDMLVGKIIENYPQTAPIFRSYGFGALLNPVLRAVFGRVTTVERGCKLHSVELEPFLNDLNKVVMGTYKEPEQTPCCSKCDCTPHAGSQGVDSKVAFPMEKATNGLIKPVHLRPIATICMQPSCINLGSIMKN